MDKISLVARRRNRLFDAPTAAMLRAEERESAAETATLEAPSEELWHEEPGVSEDYQIDTRHTTQAPAKQEPTGPDYVLETNLDATIKKYCAENLKPNDDVVLETRISQRTRSGKNDDTEQTYISITFLEQERAALLTSREVADVLKMKTATVIRMARIGKLRGYKLGHSWRFSWQDVLDAFKHVTPKQGA